MNIWTIEDKTTMLSQNIGYQPFSDMVQHPSGNEISTEQLQKPENSPIFSLATLKIKEYDDMHIC
jgi:hypothetical protein